MWRKIAAGLAAMLFLVACSSIECPIQSAVYTVYQVDGMLPDTLSVSTKRSDGTDTLLLNRGVDLTTFSLPVSHQHPVDTFLFYAHRLGVTDTVWVAKEDIPHFESVDCSTAFFHKLTDVSSTHHGIDTIVITHTTVDYDPSNAHFLVTFKTRD